MALAHGQGLYTLYGHASVLYVQVGQKIEQGQVIAAVGSTGRSTGPHLHFEVHRDGKYHNPIAYLGSQQSIQKVAAASKPIFSSRPLVESKRQVIVNIAVDYRKINSKSPYTALTTVFSSEDELYTAVNE
ncbi:MAG: M23 family metallopeptidase [Vampirovibrionales bacterium]|nr:M23 family metallopeptidase [Vampirovibrionales bacterium]